MTDQVQLALIGVIGGLPATIAALWIGLHNSAKADIIESKVDGTATAAATEIKNLMSQVSSLAKQLGEQKETAALLAQAQAAQQPARYRKKTKKDEP